MSVQASAAKKEASWKGYFYGGSSGMVAVSITHPFDLVKVRMQVNEASRMGIAQTAVSVLKSDGIIGLYGGLSASLLRQATYTTTRFGVYESLKPKFTQYYNEKGKAIPFWVMWTASMLAGAAGAIVGTPADVVLVRMQADGRLPPEKRRNYKHAIDGLAKIVRDEGVFSLWKGCTPNVFRAMLMNAGQLASYDKAKTVLTTFPLFPSDSIATHFSASLIAGLVATLVTSPLDVVKTRIMNSSKAPGHAQYANSFDCAVKILRNEGPLAFYKGVVPYFLRLGPTTILTLLAYEQIKKLVTAIETRIARA